MTGLIDVAAELQNIIDQFPIETLDGLVEKTYNLSYQLSFADKKLEEDLIQERDWTGLEILYEHQKCTEEDLELLQTFQEHVKTIVIYLNNAKAFLQPWVEENNKPAQGKISDTGGTPRSKQNPVNGAKFRVPERAVRHVLKGGVNKEGQATGYHSRPGGKDHSGWQTTNIGKPDEQGVYRATVARYDPKGRLIKKSSTFFPDDWPEKKVREVVVQTFMKSEKFDTGRWKGMYGKIRIEGWYNLETGEMTAAFPFVQAKKRG